MHRGYIKIWRKIKDWEWHDDLMLVGFFVHLVLTANYKDTRYHGTSIPRGSLVFGRKSASKQFGISERCVRTMLTKLKTTSEVTIKSTNKFSIICIVNYEKFQSEMTSKTASYASHERPATDQQLTTSKESKEHKNVKNKYGPDGLVLLSLEEHEKLTIRFGANRLNELIETMNNGIASKGYKYKSHYHALLTWSKKEYNSPKERPKNNYPICDGVPSA
jgi:hypothetical protein